MNEKTIIYDIFSYNIFVVNLRNDFLTNIVKVITYFGSASILITITILSFIFIKNRKISICISVNLILSFLLNLLFKYLIQRPRPSGYSLVNETGFSFPSGHTMTSVAFYGFILYLIFKIVKNKKLKYLFSWLLLILIMLISISRIYLGVHYASDVIAGILISVIYLIIFIKIVKKFIVK